MENLPPVHSQVFNLTFSPFRRFLLIESFFRPTMPTKFRKRQRETSSTAMTFLARSNSQPKLLRVTPGSESRCLSHDVIKHCLTYLSPAEWLSHRRISHTWCGSVADCFECLHSAAQGEGGWAGLGKELVQGTWTPTLRKESKQLLCSLNYLTEEFRGHITTLVLNYPMTFRLADGHLQGCKSLQRLIIYCTLAGETLAVHGLQTIPALQEVSITTVGPVDVSCLSRCKSLKKLSLLYCLFTENGIKGVETMTALETLSLEGSRFSHKVSYLTRCRSLKALSLVRCRDLTDSGIIGLERIPNLQSLNLSQTYLTDVSTLSKCNALKKLHLSCCSALTDAGLQGLEQIDTLEELHLGWSTSITNVSHLSGSKSLRILQLTGCRQLADSGIQGLERIPTLEQLDLSRTDVTSVSHFASCKTMTKLNLNSCQKLTDAGIIGLELISTLVELDLAQTNVANTSNLAGCQSLTLIVDSKQPPVVSDK